MTDPKDREAAVEPTHYEVLGVKPGASEAAIRRAWRRRTAKAGPGSPELARLNESADTLLDPERRTAYDESLAPAEPEPQADSQHQASHADAQRRAELRSDIRRGVFGGIAMWVAFCAFVAVVIGVAVTAGLLTHQHRHDQQVESARDQAAAAADQALQVVLAYDYRHMDKDLAAARPFLTPRFAKTYTKNFHLISQGKDGGESPVQATKTVVKAQVLGTAVMDADTDQVHVLAFVDQTSRHEAGPTGQVCSPCVLQDRVEVTMVKRGDSWLVDGLKTN